MILYNSEKSNIFTQKNIKKLQNVKLVEKLAKVIEDYENTLNFGYLTCPDCDSDELISYGTYERYVVANGVSMPITIKRVMCKHCGRTHAIIPSFLIPHFQHLASFINSIIILAIVKKNKNKELEARFELTRQLIKHWKLRFEEFRTRLLTYKNLTLKELLLEPFSSDFSRSFYERYNVLYFSKITNITFA